MTDTAIIKELIEKSQNVDAILAPLGNFDHISDSGQSNSLEFVQAFEGRSKRMRKQYH